MAVSLAVRDGRLRESVVRVDGQPKIADPDLADREWNANTDASKRMTAMGGDPRALAPIGPAGEDDAGEAPPGDLNLAAESARLKKAQADLAELKFSEAAAKLIPAVDVERRMSDVFAAARAHLLALPSRAKQTLPHLTANDLEALESVVREALTELADGKVRA